MVTVFPLLYLLSICGRDRTNRPLIEVMGSGLRHATWGGCLSKTAVTTVARGAGRLSVGSTSVHDGRRYTVQCRKVSAWRLKLVHMQSGSPIADGR